MTDDDMRRMFQWLATVLVLMLVAVLIAGVLGRFDSEQPDCTNRGGQVVQVKGGRGGWVCVPPRREP